MRLTPKQREALRVLATAQTRGQPEGVMNVSETALIDGQAWVHYRTAHALVNRRMAEFVGESEIVLTPDGYAVGSSEGSA